MEPPRAAPPLAGAAVGTFILVLLALPVLGMRLGFSDESQFNEDTTTRQAYELLSDGFGPGYNGPFFLIAQVDEEADPAVLQQITADLAADPGVAYVTPAVPNTLIAPDRDLGAYLWKLTPTTSPQHEDTYTLVHRLRDEVLVDGEAALGTNIDVTGQLPATVDFSGYMSAHAVLLRGGARAVVPAAHGRVPIGPRAAEGRDHEPPVHRRRLRRHGGARAVGVASSARSSFASLMWSRCGHSAFRWLNRLSIQAWSVGVPGRPKCCAIAHIAMNSRVEPLVICGPLSLTASRIGATRRIDGGAAQPALAGFEEPEQPFELERVGERDLNLRAGLLGGDDLADPLAGHEVHDRDDATRGQAAKCVQS